MQSIIFAFAAVIIGLIARKLEMKYYGWAILSMISALLGSIYLAYSVGWFFSGSSDQAIVRSALDALASSGSDSKRAAYDAVKDLPMKILEASQPNLWAIFVAILMTVFGVSGALFFGNVALRVAAHAGKHEINPNDIKVNYD